MSGAGVVYAVDRVSDRDGARVWRLWVADGPENAAARAEIAANRPVVSDMPAHVAVNMPRPVDPSSTNWAVCPIAVGAEIEFDAHHIRSGGIDYPKLDWEYDPDGPLSPA